MSAQTSVSIFGGYSPSKHVEVNERPLTNPFNTGTDYAMAPVYLHDSFLFGISATYELRSAFFLQGELMYQNTNIRYGIRPIGTDDERIVPRWLEDSKGRISMPVSVGARWGRFHVLSGVMLNMDFGGKNELNLLRAFDDDSARCFASWQAGLGARFGSISVEVRYTQDFRNIGYGYSVDGKELIYYGHHGRLNFALGYILK